MILVNMNVLLYPPVLIYNVDGGDPPGEEYMLMADGEPILLSDGEFIALA